MTTDRIDRLRSLGFVFCPRRGMGGGGGSGGGEDDDVDVDEMDTVPVTRGGPVT
jgi:hypothetical protein